jgi:large subunit ribosomal protein L24
MAARIRRDDEVIVISGKDRGKTGKVLRVDPGKDRVYVTGLNIVKRHTRPSQTATGNQLGGVIEREGPIHISNVMLIDPKDKKRTRVGISRDGAKRSRVSRRTGSVID